MRLIATADHFVFIKINMKTPGKKLGDYTSGHRLYFFSIFAKVDINTINKNAKESSNLGKIVLFSP